MSSGSERDLLKEALQKIRALRAELAARDATVAARRSHDSEPIAIIGAGCRFPGGADSLEAFWQLLIDGRDAIREVPADRWDVDRFFDADPDAPGASYVRHGGFLEDVAGFDAEFFGVSPREAPQLDPQQRLLLEVAWEALEHAAIAPDSLQATTTGVYVGVMSADYALRQAHGIDPARVDPYMLSGNDLSFTAGRLAYVLGLQGPAMAVSTACSSSLVSLHLASQALRAGECDLAIAGGVNLVLDPITNVMLSKLRALAPDGRCRTFDASARGYGRGEGCGMVVLARLSDATARGARILGVIRGSAVNHDGPSAGLTVPNGSAQEKLLRRAWDVAGIDPARLSYVEAHGTGTSLGDPIELTALASARGNGSEPVLVGSVKTNIGHLEAAAGVASVLKVVSALQHATVPPHLHFETPNPHVDWDRLPIRVPVAPAPLPPAAIAGVSAFGLSGVNAHIVIEAAPPGHERPHAAGARRLLPISARSAEALEALIARYDAWLAANPDASWDDVCFTAGHGRSHFEHRVAVVAASAVEARLALRDAARSHVVRQGRVVERDPDVAARRYLEGATIDWRALDGDAASRRPVTLPTYAFQRRRYWALDATGPVRQPDAAGPESAVQADTIEEAIATVLALPRELSAYRERSLLELGLDSLMALELRTWAQRQAGVDLDLAMLLSSQPIGTLLERWRAAPLASGSPKDAVGREPRGGSVGGVVTRHPLSHGQRALWFEHQAAPESPAYNVGVALRIRSRIDVARLTAAFQDVVARHPSLRSRVVEAEGEAVQVVASPVPVSIARHDVSGLSEADIRARVRADYARPFDLATGPLFRLSLYEQADTAHVLLLTLHHIICDATSCWTMIEEVQARYEGHALPAPPAPYSEYVETQREMLRTDEGARLWRYWRARLSGELPVLDLPLDRPRPPISARTGGTIARVIPPALAARLRSLAQSKGATLYALLLASYQALLHRYTGQTDLIVGSAAFARPQAFSRTVGYFVNPLPIRVDASGDPRFVDFVEQVRTRALEALEHQQFPFALMVERLQPKRDAGRTPIFQADFAFGRDASAYRPGLGQADAALTLERFDLAEEEGQFDLGLHVTERVAGGRDAGALVAAFKYDAALFDPETIERMAAGWVTLLEGVASDPEQTLSALPLLSPEMRAHTLALGRGPVREWPYRSLIEIVAAQAAATPDAIAVEVGEKTRTLTYRELETASTRMSARLRRAGAGRGSLVAVALPRDADLLVTLLAVLKSGAAYLPLDPAYPHERLAFMIADSSAALVVTTSAIAARVGAGETPLVVLDAATSVPDGDAKVDASEPNAPDDLAYVIYTSGSTGQPKGAQLTHGALMNYLRWAVEAYDVRGGCGAPVNSSIGFDATITALFLPLMTGGRVVLLPEAQTIDALAGVLAEGRRFSLVKITPAHLELLAHTLPPEAHADAARALVIGGEALRGDLLEPWRRHAPDVRLLNEYGPTETVVGCCVQEVVAEVRGAVPIGRPIANTQLYVLDDRRQPVPIGVVGELYIGGAGVGAGYLNRPELTAERFVPDPFSTRPGARMYRTGDFVRLRNDGVFEFLGRRDGQVKIRGHRVELGEIEAVLASHAGVADAVVVVRDEHDAPALAAYVVPGGDLDRGALRRYLAERLPEPMRPASLTLLDALPLTPNGKVDRRALPRPESPVQATFTPPRDTVEMTLAGIWEELLEARPIGVRDDFFELGGHSLLAVRMMARVRQALGVDAPLADVLRAPTIEALADRLRGRRITTRSTLVPIQPAGRARPFFCLPGAGGNTLYFYTLARQLGEDQPFFGIQGVGFDGEAPPHATVEEMAAHAVREIRGRQPHGPYAIGGHSLGAWVAFETAQRLIAEGESVATLAVIDTPVPHPAAFRDTSDWDQARWIVELADRIARLLDPDLRISLEELRTLPEPEQLEAFRRALDRTNLFPGAAGAAHLRHALALFKAHGAVRYALPSTVARTRLTLLRTEAPPPHLAAVAGDPTWGWSAVADVDVHVVPGDHLAVLRPPHVAVLAERLRAALAEGGATASAVTSTLGVGIETPGDRIRRDRFATRF